MALERSVFCGGAGRVVGGVFTAVGGGGGGGNTKVNKWNGKNTEATLYRT